MIEMISDVDGKLETSEQKMDKEVPFPRFGFVKLHLELVGAENPKKE